MPAPATDATNPIATFVQRVRDHGERSSEALAHVHTYAAALAERLGRDEEAALHRRYAQRHRDALR